VSDYVETGKVRFEFRDYAFRSEQAVRAAEAAACASDQGQFWAFHDTLFMNQTAADAFSDPRLKEMARSLGLDTAAFNRCLDGGEKRQEVEDSLAAGKSQGVDSTPSVFVNGANVPWEGWESLKQAIDAELAKQP
jgi:protein-disulfide isomerase